ncbi:MAG: hypothetical protein JXA19_04680 [Anaerolineales bacterium]|nr:hypothetical protein [Anaerolineales bacterium]
MPYVTLLAFFLAVFSAGLIRDLCRRKWLLFTTSVLVIFWLQPSSPIRYLDFWLPVLTIGLVVIVWSATAQKEKDTTDKDWLTGLVLAGIVLVIALTRFVPWLQITASRPPQFLYVLTGLLILSVLSWGMYRGLINKRFALTGLVLLILVGFVFLKYVPLSELLSRWLRSLNGQDPALATPYDIGWLGFSYVAFRLIHVIREGMNRKLGQISLQEMIIYTIFFPAVSAGPIDKAPRFLKDLNENIPLTAETAGKGLWRITIGLLKKYVVADTLALVALNQTNALQTESSGWMWVLVYIYAFRIYFDFSGYTDIAIGLGQLTGINLPENFRQPYLKPNLTHFWNNWHITLAQWFRTYYFNPVTRRLRRKKVPLVFIAIIGQVGTMVLIGLWHGITLNFLLWGLWHGVGLFLHNHWDTATKSRIASLSEGKQKAIRIVGVVTTFHFVALGWVWFALPSLDLSLHTFAVILGLA